MKNSENIIIYKRNGLVIEDGVIFVFCFGIRCGIILFVFFRVLKYRDFYFFYLFLLIKY